MSIDWSGGWGFLKQQVLFYINKTEGGGRKYELYTCLPGCGRIPAKSGDLRVLVKCSSIKQAKQRAEVELDKC